MKAQQRRILFDTRSVMLFAAISLGGAGALQAQGQTKPSSPQFGPTESSKPPSSASSSPGPASSTSPMASAATFDRADTNRDGQLSSKEAAKLPAMGQRFQELDADQNGALSRDEFQKGANT